MLVFFDTETNDKVRWGVYPICIQLAWAVGDKGEVHSRLVRTDAKIASGAQKVHGITSDMLQAEGHDPQEVYKAFLDDVRRSSYLVAHNAEFDRNVMLRSLREANVCEEDVLMFQFKPVVCTMRILTPVTCLDYPAPWCTGGELPEEKADTQQPRKRRKSYKWPRLLEAARFFKLTFDSEAAHDAAYDVVMLREIYRCMLKHPNPHLKKLAAKGQQKLKKQ